MREFVPEGEIGARRSDRRAETRETDMPRTRKCSLGAFRWVAVYKARGCRETSSFHRRLRATMSTAAFLTLGKSAVIGRDFLIGEGRGQF